MIINSQPGRKSEAEVQPGYIKIWADLMHLHEEGKKEAVKITRYNRIPDHLVGTGVSCSKLILHSFLTRAALELELARLTKLRE